MFPAIGGSTGSVERGVVLRLLEEQAGLVPAEIKDIQRQRQATNRPCGLSGRRLPANWAGCGKLPTMTAAGCWRVITWRRSWLEVGLGGLAHASRRETNHGPAFFNSLRISAVICFPSRCVGETTKADLPAATVAT